MSQEKKRPTGVPSDFWDIAALVPPRAKRGTYREPPRRQTDTRAVPVSVPQPQGKRQTAPVAGTADIRMEAVPVAAQHPLAPPQGEQGATRGNAPLLFDDITQNGAEKIAVSQPQNVAQQLQSTAPQPQNGAEKIAVPQPQNVAQQTTVTVEAVATAPTVHLMSQTGTVMAGDVPLPRRELVPAAPTEAPRPERVYRPEGGFLREVRVFLFGRPHTYYAAFANHAKKLKDFEGKEVPHVPFFSYMPQYTQLTRPQLAYYFWWRTSFRRGVALEADYSYLLLYIFEIINLGDEIDPQTGQESLQRLWLSYRGQYPRLDGVLREWLCDYALVHGLAPLPLPAGQLRALVTDARLKEFYLGAGKGESLLDAVLAFSSNYDYRKSKFYRGEHVALFDRVLRGAAKLALEALMRENSEGEMPLGHSTVTRESFSGALCTSRQKKRIEVDFVSFSHTYRLRYVLSDVLKYAENAVRAHLGIKSRLSVYEVPNDLREALECYLATALPPKSVRAVGKTPAPMPDYEKRYELPQLALSLDRAATIEAESWQTTRRLVEAFGGIQADADPLPAVPVGREKNEKYPETVSKTDTLHENGSALHATRPQEDVAPTSPQEPAAPTRPGECVAPTRPQEGVMSTRPQQGVMSTRPEEGVASTRPQEGVPSTCPTDSRCTQGGAHGKGPLAEALGDLAAFLPLVARGDTAAMRAFSGQRGLMVDAVCDRINTVAVDLLGDVILEESMGTWQIIEDYRTDLEEGLLS